MIAVSLQYQTTQPYRKHHSSYLSTNTYLNISNYLLYFSTLHNYKQTYDIQMDFRSSDINSNCRSPVIRRYITSEERNVFLGIFRRELNFLSIFRTKFNIQSIILHSEIYLCNNSSYALPREKRSQISSILRQLHFQMVSNTHNLFMRKNVCSHSTLQTIFHFN
jgi:hypothetical protein